MPRSGNFKAWIAVDGQPLQEFKVQTDRDGTTRCWIASEEGKQFVIHWRDEERDVPLSVSVSIDGTRFGSKIWRKYGRVETVSASPTTLARLAFGKVILTEDESRPLDDAARTGNIGLIKLRIQSGTCTPTAHNGSSLFVDAPRATSKPYVDIKPVHEKLKKAGCHRVVLVEPMERPTRNAESKAAQETFHPDSSPEVVFVFQYKPKAHLQAADIIPRDPFASLDNTVDSNSSQPFDDEAKGTRVLVSQSDEEDESQIEALKSQISALNLRIQDRKANGMRRIHDKKPKFEGVAANSFLEPSEIIDLT